MHQSIPTAPSPHPPGYCRAFARLVTPRGRTFANFALPWGPGICQPWGQPRAFDTHTVSYQNITTQRILLEKQEDWLICQGREKIEEVCKGMISTLCIYIFIVYQARITQRNSGAIDVSQGFSTLFPGRFSLALGVSLKAREKRPGNEVERFSGY